MADIVRSSRKDATATNGLEGVLERFSTFVDENIQYIKISAYAVGGMGALLIVRHYVRLVVNRKCRQTVQNKTRLYSSVSSVPNYLLKSNSSISAHVCDVRQTYIMVQHRPLARRLLSRLGFPYMALSHRRNSLIRVDFAGAGIANTKFVDTESFLEKTLLEKTIRCQLIKGNDHQGIDCLVFRRKLLFFESCVNEELLKEGLATVKSIDGVSSKKAHSQITQKMIKAENKAKLWRRGLWKDAKDSLLSEGWKWSVDTIQNNLTISSSPQMSRVSVWLKENQLSQNVLETTTRTRDRVNRTRKSAVAVWTRVRRSVVVDAIERGWRWTIGKIHRISNLQAGSLPKDK